MIAAATCPSGSSSSLSVTLSLHLRSMEPSGQESSEGGTHIRSQGCSNLQHNGLNTLFQWTTHRNMCGSEWQETHIFLILFELCHKIHMLMFVNLKGHFLSFLEKVESLS